jgi:hypothetical protein
MAVQKIIGKVVGISRSTETPEDEAEVIVNYMVTGMGTGARTGEVLFQINMTQNETQINDDIRTALAAYVDPLVGPPQGFAAVDVRGCNL